MKKLMILIIVLVLAVCAGRVAYASSASDAVGVLLTVGPKFAFVIGEDVVDMGTVAEGAGGVGGVTMYCSTNQGNPWTILVRTTDVTGGTTAATIPLSNFKFQTYALADGDGANSSGTFVATDTALAATDTLAYRSATSEASDTDVRVGMVLILNVPYGTPADTYAATVTATMAE
jgi:hypothetical protein